MKYRILLVALMIITINYIDAEETSYQPNYIYGSQPLGAYIGGFNPNKYSGAFIPNSAATNDYYTPQSGQPMEMSQFIQGQEQLMQSRLKEQQQQKQREKEIADYLQQEYYRQIHGDHNKVNSSSVL